jgi:hypothetical protein
MKGDDFILEVNSKEKITKLKFLKDGIETGYEKTHYQGDSNDTLPKVKVLSFTKTEPNGKKIERVTVTTFSEYQLN